MASVALQSPTDADVGAWDKIFRYFNKTPRKLERGRQKGEVVAVKINLNNGGTRKKDNLCDAPPQTVLAVVRQLVNKTGVPEENVLVYDVERQFFSETSTPLWSEFPKIRILQDGGARREQPRNPAREIEGANWVGGPLPRSETRREASPRRRISRQLGDVEARSYPYNYMEDGDKEPTTIATISKNRAGAIRGVGGVARVRRHEAQRDEKRLQSARRPLRVPLVGRKNAPLSPRRPLLRAQAA